MGLIQRGLFGLLTVGTFATLALGQGRGDEPAASIHHKSGESASGTTTSHTEHRPQGQSAHTPEHTSKPGGYQSNEAHRTTVTRTAGGVRTEHQLAGGHRMVEATRQVAGHGSVHTVRYGRGVTGTVERTIRPGAVSRTYVLGGHVLYARVYQQHTFQRFGRTFSYQSVVPAMTFSPTYYAWAATPWHTPVSYRWGWRAQPWYAAFGDYFTPYPRYTSLDLWMTDYVIAQNMATAYQAWQGENAPPPGEQDADAAAPADEAAAAPAPAASPKSKAAARSAAPAADPGPPPPEASPPPVTSDIKAELDAQIKQQLNERNTATTAASDEASPSSLRPGHKLFRVSAPLDVPSDTPGQHCSLSADDYIERTGSMDSNGTVPVEVKSSGISDCGTGLVTRVSVNDLEAMDSDQQEQLTNAMLAASKSMGPNGLPSAPGTTPLLVAAGQARPEADAPGALSHL